MKNIQKNKTGKGYQKLLKIHKDKGCYDDTKNDNSKIPPITIRTDILKDLLDEQGYVCAYCMRKISLEDAQIEHIIGQNYIDKNKNKVGKIKDTDYNNMLAVCQGNFCNNETHCDSSRSKYQDKRPLLSISPLNALDMNHIKFTQSGVIYYEEFEAMTDMNYDLNKVLNLNCNSILEKRKRIIRSIKHLLSKYKFNKKVVQKELGNWEINKQEFSQVVILELRKYI